MNFVERINNIFDRIEAEPLHPIWISIADRNQVLARAATLEDSKLPLAGVPFAVKDNMDVAGMATTAGCPAYSFRPEASATVVKNLEAQGAILIGKTNMDQFATGLVGTRSPYGACSSVFDQHYISGGSSSGSAVAVAKGFVDFSLGTDTAGSGRVPAAFNNLIGLKPTRGVISTFGVVPACRSLDCVSIFSKASHTAHLALQAAKGLDTKDPYSRVAQTGNGAAPWLGGSFRFGVPPRNQLEFFGDDEAANAFDCAVVSLQSLGGQKVEIDFTVFRTAANLLYEGPWVAERLAAIQDFIKDHAAEMNPVVQGIISGGNRYSAVNTFEAVYKLRALQRVADEQWRAMDILLLPTTGTIYTHEQVAADPVKTNTNLGYYTNFVNLLDLAAVAVPAGFRSNGLPFGISLIGPAFTEESLLVLADRYHRATALVDGPVLPMPEVPRGCIAVAVVGAHLQGQPLNWQLTDRGGRFVKSCRTAAGYRLYALDGTKPAKPGLVRDLNYAGPGIELELWAVPEDQFGGFVAAVPPPLGIGNATLDSGQTVKCFICEQFAIDGAKEITHFGGWRKYLTSLT